MVRINLNTFRIYLMPIFAELPPISCCFFFNFYFLYRFITAIYRGISRHGNIMHLLIETASHSLISKINTSGTETFEGYKINYWSSIATFASIFTTEQ